MLQTTETLFQIKDLSIPSESGEVLNCTRYLPTYHDTHQRIVFFHGLGSSKEGSAGKFAREFMHMRFECVTTTFSGHPKYDPKAPASENVIDCPLSNAIKDIRSVIKEMNSIEPKETLIFASSYGGQAALCVLGDKDFCAENSVTRAVLRAPLLDTAAKLFQNFGPKDLDKLDGPQKLVAQGKQMLISERTIKDILARDAKAILRNVELPVLIVHDPKDNILDISDARIAVHQLSKGQLIELSDSKGHHWTVEDLKKLGFFVTVRCFLTGDITELRFPKL